MEIFYGESGLERSWQKEFKKTCKCSKKGCKGTARIGFVCYESDCEKYVCDLHENGKDGKYWLHDACAVAVYFCEKCLDTTAQYNQA